MKSAISIYSGRIALVFGPEDRGLDNVDTQLCNMLITIPTATEASSLNLAQAVLLILYEFNKVFKKNFTHIKGIADQAKLHNLVNADEFSRMMTSLKEMLCQIDYLHGNNSDYFMLIWKNLLSRSRLRRYEYDAIMGLCRQVKNIGSVILFS